MFERKGFKKKNLFFFYGSMGKNEREERMSSQLYSLGTFFLFIEDLSHRSCIKGGK